MKYNINRFNSLKNLTNQRGNYLFPHLLFLTD